MTAKTVETVFDESDYVKPAHETSAIFIATRIQVVNGQSQSFCGRIECKNDTDCVKIEPLMPGKCLAFGFCQEYTWCPPALGNQLKNYTLQKIDELTLRFTAFLRFSIENSLKIYTTPQLGVDILYPAPNATAIVIKDLLEAASVTYDKIKDTGIVIQVLFSWKCSLGKEACLPEMRITALDNATTENSLVRFTYYH